MENQKRIVDGPSFGYSLFVMSAVFFSIMYPALRWGAKINALFLIGWAVAILLCIPVGATYRELEAGLIVNCSKAIVPAMIVLCVGALVGTWNAAGTVPVIISLGVRSISPQFFLPTAFLLCVITTLITGTSWGTFGTAGLALAGIGVSLNIDPVVTAGAVCGGSFFGDTISPLSDSPNIAAAVSGVNLFTGIRHQAKVTIPSALICMSLYFFAGFQYRGGGTDNSLIRTVVSCIDENFKTGMASFLPMLFVIVLLVFKMPSIPAILGGGIFGGVVAYLYQGVCPADIISYFWNGYRIDTGVAFVDTLLNRGGITSMTNTAIMFFFAFGLFGILNAAGIVDAFVKPIVNRLHSKLSLVAATVLMSVLGTLVGASMNFAYAFAGNIMAPVYEARGLEKENLMRALGVGCTAMTVLIPWSLSAVVASEFLGVTTTQLIPYNFFVFVTPAVLLLRTWSGSDTKWTSETMGITPHSDK